MIINEDIVPSTLNEAVELIIAALASEDYPTITGTSRDQFLIGSHLILSPIISQLWSLDDKDSRLVKWFVENHGIGNSDDIVVVTMSAVWHKVNKKRFMMKALLEKQKKFWEKNNLNIYGEKLYS